MNISSISTDVIGVIALLFTIILAKRNAVIDSYKTKIYIFVSGVTISLLILEIFDILLEFSYGIEFLELHKIINIIGFSLTPLVPYLLLFLNSREIFVNKTLYAIPLIINALLSILSYKTGWVFLFDTQGQHVRGNLFFISIAISTFYYLLLIFSVIKNDLEYDNEDLTFLKFVFFVPLTAVILQITFYGFNLIWASVALSLLLYYIFLRELQFKYDVTSGIKNRKAFEKEIERYDKNHDNFAMVVLDLNDLKKINDTKGHNYGDEAILISATVLQESFYGVGKAYRIGGDEFCVICNNATKANLDSSLARLEQLLDIVNQKRDIKIVFAYGYEFYKKNTNDSIPDVFSKADKFMYEHKAKLKGFYGRRIDDLDAEGLS
ncbi:MAG: GGDEF domain-containing protein [Sedimentibacter sp.]